MKPFQLEELQQLLKNEGFHFYLCEVDQDHPFPRVCIFMGKDHQERERVLEIHIKQQKLDHNVSHLILEYIFRFPFHVKDIAISDLSRYFAFVNRSSDFPGFELDEINNCAFFRYVLLMDQMVHDPNHVIAIIGLIRLYLDMFTEEIEKIAKGMITTNQIIEHALNKLTK